MPKKPEDDLFRESTMTFGEHLEALRTCLFKAVLGLAVCFLIGLLFGQDVVRFIQSPLSKALTAHYKKQSVDRVTEVTENLKGTNEALPWTDKEISHLVNDRNFLADEVYVDPTNLFQQLKAAYPEKLAEIQLPEKPKETQGGETDQTADVDIKLIRLFLWHKTDDDTRLRTKSLNAQEPFTIWVKASLLVGVILASPWIFFQLWQFVAAGLYPHERRYVHTFLPFSIGLFLLGTALAFVFVFEPVLKFLLMWNTSLGIDPEPRINEWLGFVLILPIGFGIGFQLPLVMLFLERIGVFTVRSYLKQWKIAIFVIFILSAMLTPPDPSSMMLMAAPLTLLYFGGVLLCKLLPRKSSPFG